MKKILVATDGSEPSSRAVKLACEEAKYHTAELTVLHVIGCDEMVMLPTFGESYKAKTPPLSYPLVSPGKLDIENVRFEASQERLKEGEEAIQKAMKIAEEVGIKIKTKILRADPKHYYLDPKRLIVKYVQENDFDIIVLGSQGRTGLTRVLLGSVCEYVVRHAPCPVFISR